MKTWHHVNRLNILYMRKDDPSILLLLLSKTFTKIKNNDKNKINIPVIPWETRRPNSKPIYKIVRFCNFVTTITVIRKL